LKDEHPANQNAGEYEEKETDVPEVSARGYRRSHNQCQPAQHRVERDPPLCVNSFVGVSNFLCKDIPGYEFGSMMQSLIETMDRLVQDPLPLFAGLEQRYRQSSGVHLPCENFAGACTASLRTM
jgi:hypothetical protein